MLSNDQIEAEMTKIAANLAKTEQPRQSGESLEHYSARQELIKLEMATSALTLLTNFLQNINDIAKKA